jgi:hypothetical protein
MGSPDKISELAYRLALGLPLTLTLAALMRSGFSIPRMRTKRITRMTIMKDVNIINIYTLLILIVVYTPYTALSTGKLSNNAFMISV